MAARRKHIRLAVSTNWDPVADWYKGWVGEAGSQYHQQLVLPAVLSLLEPHANEYILDIGAGSGVLAPWIAAAGARYTGVDASTKLLQFARVHHGQHGRFLYGDAASLSALPELRATKFDAAVFMLSIQDMQPLDAVLRSAAWALRGGGRLIVLMTHPCFRVPRQSGWGWDDGRQLRYRRVDRYLSTLTVPMKGYGKHKPGATRSFHRPLQLYINELATCGLLIDCMREIAAPTTPVQRDQHARAEYSASQEIPLFLALRARKLA